MSYCSPEASCAHVRHQCVCKRREEAPWGSAGLRPQAHSCWGQQEGGTDPERVCAESAAVVVDQEMHRTQLCFFMGF